MSSKILLPVINNRVLIFELEDVKKLRKLGILGVLSGTLPKAPQQNIFLGIPLQLSLNEIVWLVENEHGILVSSRRYHENNNSREIMSDTKPNSDFISIPNTIEVKNKDLVPISLKDFISSQYTTQEQGLELAGKYRTFKAVKNKGYFILPGLRFGGELIAYPGDPLRYHSHLIINTACLRINLQDLVAGGRLATGVKKVWLLVGDNVRKDDSDTIDALTKKIDPLMFSIEWAGFG